jgi:hypothetical protein
MSWQGRVKLEGKREKERLGWAGDELAGQSKAEGKEAGLGW